MVKTVEYKDPGRLELIKALESVAKESQSKLWATIADELSRVRKNRRVVNVYHISKNTAEGDVVVVPGKVLGDGVIDHKVLVAAYRFSDGAQKKITQAGGKAISILDLIKENPNGKKIKLIG